MKKLFLQNNLLESAKTELEQLYSIKIQLQQDLQKAPEGTLHISSWKNTWQYYKATPETKGKGKYLSKRKEIKIIQQLAQKQYDKTFFHQLSNEIQTLENFINNYKPQTVTELYDNWPSSTKTFVQDHCLNKAEYIQNWLQTTPHKTYLPENLKFTTSFGLKVRSKSELMIAEALHSHKIPFRYEYPVKLNSIGTIYPDFLCLNPRTLKEIIWEHFGMMDDKEYANNAIKKIISYQKCDYIPGKNFCFTQETSAQPLDTKQINCVIKNYIL
ncbi:MAG: hypothetical protein MJ188_10390 [Treponema sp.]|nr:hypothetical protein [Treponema sp.]